MMVLFQLLLHGVFNLVRVFQIHRHHAQRVADEVDREMVFEDFRIGREDRAVVRLLDMRFQRDDALGLHRLGQLEQQGEQVDIVLLLPLRTGQQLAEILQRLHDRAEGVADQERRRRRPRRSSSSQTAAPE
jgi:hypothetical protein